MNESRVKIIDRMSAIEAIKQLDEADLQYLNQLIVERLKLIHQARSTALMSAFSAGDRVGFQDRQGRYHRGVVVRLNQKTISVETEGRRQWKVSPSMLDLLGHPSDRLCG